MELYLNQNQTQKINTNQEGNNMKSKKCKPISMKLLNKKKYS